jgi:hypothetical protein
MCALRLCEGGGRPRRHAADKDAQNFNQLGGTPSAVAPRMGAVGCRPCAIFHDSESSCILDLRSDTRGVARTQACTHSNTYSSVLLCSIRRTRCYPWLFCLSYATLSAWSAARLTSRSKYARVRSRSGSRFSQPW